MLTDEPSNDANAGSEIADETDGPTLSSPNTDEDRDVTTADDVVPAMSTEPGPVAGRKRGRRTKLTPETQERLRAGVAEGLPIELAARRAGVGASTFYEWRDIGERALEKQSKGQVVADRERTYLDLVIVLRVAQAEYYAGLHAKLEAEATNHRKTKTRIKFSCVTFRNEVLRDDNGEFLLLPTYTWDVTEEPDVRALIALHKNARDQLARTAQNETRPDRPDDTHAPAESVERRLARSINLRREQIGEDADDARMAGYQQPAGKTPAFVVPTTTDDDGDDYLYAFWVPFAYWSPTPETPETPEAATHDAST